MELSFVLMRIECCNQYKDTPCRVALVGVKNSQMEEQREFFIDPEDSLFEFMISGTQLADLRGKGNFVEHWEDIQSFIRRYPLLIATADGYDADVLFNAISRYHVDCAPIPYLTAKNILRRSVSTYSYRFDFLCDLLNIPVTDSCMPLDLVSSWGDLLIAALKDNEAQDLVTFVDSNKITIGSISSEYYKKCYIKRIYKPRKRENLELDESNFDEEHPFYGQNVVFTGTLQYFERAKAQEYVECIGGHCPSGLSKTTNYLVVGVQSPSQVGHDGFSSKQKKAIKYKEEGVEIELLSETEFIDIMGLQNVIDWKKYVDETFLAPLRK